MNDQFDYSLELGKTALQNYFSSNYKDTQAVIHHHIDFFHRINTVDHVFILGHSLSDVDLPYFEKIVTSMAPRSVFTVSYFGDKEHASHIHTLYNPKAFEIFILFWIVVPVMVAC